MRKNHFPLLVILFLFTKLYGQGKQVVANTQQALSSKDFATLQSKIDSQPGAHWECLRDITKDFKEGVLLFGYTIKDKDNPAMGTDYNFRVNLITSKKIILYYELSEQKYNQKDDDWIPHYKTICNFKNDSLYTILKTSFKSIFSTDLDTTELFLTDIVFGNRCGMAGIAPKERQDIDNLVDKKDKKSILKWLKSANSEKQVYAIDGLYQLKLKGIKLTRKELEMIKFIKAKQGTINICSGCIHSRQEMRSMTNRFKF